jgi:hypothetical protein
MIYETGVGKILGWMQNKINSFTVHLHTTLLIVLF